MVPRLNQMAAAAVKSFVQILETIAEERHRSFRAAADTAAADPSTTYAGQGQRLRVRTCSFGEISSSSSSSSFPFSS